MSNESVVKLHWSFWVVCVLGLLWNIGGAANYLMQTNAEFVATLPETHRAIIDDRPFWAAGGFAVGVFGGILGCLLLLLRKSSSIYIFLISLAGILVTMIHTINIARSQISFSIFEIVIMVILPIVVALGLLWFAKYAVSKYRFGK